MTTTRTVSAAIRTLALADAVDLLMARYPDAAVVAAKWDDAASPVTLDGDPTAMQVADFAHCDRKAAQWARKTSGRSVGREVLVVSRWYDLGEWVTTARRYS